MQIRTLNLWILRQRLSMTKISSKRREFKAIKKALLEKS